MKRNDHKTRVNEENQVIFRDILLPIPTDLRFKVEVSTRSSVSLVLKSFQCWPEAAH